MSNLDKYKSDLDSLIKRGETMELDLNIRHLEDKGELTEEDKKNFNKFKGAFEKNYQRWYTESAPHLQHPQ